MVVVLYRFKTIYNLFIHSSIWLANFYEFYTETFKLGERNKIKHNIKAQVKYVQGTFIMFSSLSFINTI